jgi:hypothetical protein
VNCSGKSSNLQVETDQTRTPRVAETLRTGIWVDCGYRRRGDGACRPGRGRARFTLRIKGDGRGKTKLLNEYATTSRAFSDAVQRLRRPDADVEAFIRALAETGTAHRACEHSRIKLDKTPDPTWPPALTATLDGSPASDRASSLDRRRSLTTLLNPPKPTSNASPTELPQQGTELAQLVHYRIVSPSSPRGPVVDRKGQ